MTMILIMTTFNSDEVIDIRRHLIGHVFRQNKLTEKDNTKIQDIVQDPCDIKDYSIGDDYDDDGNLIRKPNTDFET